MSYSIPDKKNKTFNDIYELHIDILKQQDVYMQNNLLVDKLNTLLQLIGESGKNITDTDQRQLLESIARYWRIIIQGNKDLKISLDLPDKQTQKIQQVSISYGEEDQREIQEFLLSSLKKIATPNFNEIVISFVWESLTYYGETLEEKKQLERSIFCLCQVAYLKSLYKIIINWLDKKAKSSLSDFLGNRYIYELFDHQLNEYDKVSWKLDQKSQSRKETSEQGKILYLFYDNVSNYILLPLPYFSSFVFSIHF